MTSILTLSGSVRQPPENLNWMAISNIKCPSNQITILFGPATNHSLQCQKTSDLIRGVPYIYDPHPVSTCNWVQYRIILFICSILTQVLAIVLYDCPVNIFNDFKACIICIHLRYSTLLRVGMILSQYCLTGFDWSQAARNLVGEKLLSWPRVRIGPWFTILLVLWHIGTKNSTGKRREAQLDSAMSERSGTVIVCMTATKPVGWNV